MGIVFALIFAVLQSSNSNGSVTGTVTSAGGGSLPEMIVYLEPIDPTQPVPAPKTPGLVVSQKGATFAPPLLLISVGQSVEFRNDEDKPIEHNVFSRSPAKAFDLGLYPPGTAGKTVTFDKPGVIRLYCSIHRYMDGVIYVCPTPMYAKVNQGAFTISDVPPGKWRLRTWQRSPRYNEQDMAVTVESGKTTELKLEMTR